ncbi:hypothetical protein DC347_19580 [Pseudarthrobacter sp. AG30]|uniref:hypothetical protein n=1 Tax=unclassified Pseudarthrobacter TaxID=2647000 RepID=UPI000D6E44A4|nr:MULTISPECIES: hypothetical protein [unclassified Pseudarthrobacter]QDG63825.1 hypothetical protein NIBR502771_16910 [Pseudarthrobacter sp. NIBRBAC000502771]RAX15023.1 hypothetical protein DC347_19580 [Pseudarthrobacter sp. AG30]
MTNERNRPEMGTERDRETLTGPPRWVKVSAIVAGILILVVIAVMLLTGGQHGPARHGFGIAAPVSPPAAVQSQPDPPAFRHDGGQM